MLSSDGTVSGDLGEIDPDDYKLLAVRLLGAGAKVLDEGGKDWTWARINGYSDAMFVYGTYKTLEKPDPTSTARWQSAIWKRRANNALGRR